MSQDTAGSKESSISVAVRVRPFTDTEKQHLVQTVPDLLLQSDGSLSSSQNSTRSFLQPKGLRKILNVVDDRMLVFDPLESNQLNKMLNNAFPNKVQLPGRSNNRIREHRFIFDRLFDEESTQEEVYMGTTKPLLDSVLDGFNATVFAYGATGCGKTHTITGTPNSPGIIFSTMKELFAKMDEKKTSHIIEITLSYLEIYNESIRDLLSEPCEGSKPLNIREDQNKRITVSNLSSYKPESVDQVMELIMTGNSHRTISPTELNLTSSRSHAVLQINVDSKPRTSSLTEEHTFATLSIIDLAGSERASSTKNTGERLHEGANINKSLLALGNCINALCDPRRRNHVPYRDSKLTRLLKFSLGGNCKTVMIVCVSPSSFHYDETLNTLKYANRAKEIKTKVIRNQHNLSRHVGSYLKMITEQKQEIEELKSRENKIVQQSLMKQSLLREKIQKMLLEGIEELSNAIAKHEHIKKQKLFVLAKRKIVSVLKQDIDHFLHCFDELFNVQEDEDFTEFDSIVPGFSSVLHKAETLLTKFIVQIEELEKTYSRETELDHILSNSSLSIVRRLSEYDGWTSFDAVNFDLHVDKLRATVERDILFESSVIFDESHTALSSLKFPFDSFLYLLKCNLEEASVKVDSLKSIVREMTQNFDQLLQEDIKLNLQMDLSQRPFLPPSPRRRTIKRATSPLNRSPAKISKPRSPVRQSRQKKVRWEVPSSNGSVFQDDGDEEEEEEEENNDNYDDSNTNEANENDQESGTSDSGMNDTPLHEKLWNKMNISPPKSNNGEILRNFKTKNKSLASRRLVPPSLETDSPNRLNDNYDAVEQPQQAMALVMANSDNNGFHSAFEWSSSQNEAPKINFIGTLSPSRMKFDMGPPQRIFQPIKPDSPLDSQHSSRNTQREYQGVDNNTEELSVKPGVSMEDTIMSTEAEMTHSGSDKENLPARSVFGEISSIF